MEKGLAHNIYNLEVLQGFTEANVDRLSQVILQNSSIKFSNDPTKSIFEDCHCPDSAILDQIIEEMQKVYSTLPERRDRSLETTSHSSRDDTPPPSSDRLSLTGKWGLIHERNMSTNTHSHGDVDIAGVLYLSVPKGAGVITFWPNPLENYRYTIPPKKGMFLLFPGWIPHSVTRNLSDEPRVSISMNFKLNLEES